VGAARATSGARPGRPPLEPFGLILHRDGRWTHEGEPIRNARLRAVFDRSVRYLPEERKYVVQVGRFRGQIEVEDTGFFVRSLDAASGSIELSDRSREPLDAGTLEVSPEDGAYRCRVKRELAPPDGLPARFTHAAQAELLHALEETPDGPALRLAGKLTPVRGI
jgi:hypothetical protein